MKIDERALAQLFAEMKEAQGQALAILTMALCKQVDAAQLTADLRRQIDSAKQVPGISPLAVGIAAAALAAAEAEKMMRARPPGEGPYPKR